MAVHLEPWERASSARAASVARAATRTAAWRAGAFRRRGDEPAPVGRRHACCRDRPGTGGRHAGELFPVADEEPIRRRLCGVFLCAQRSTDLHPGGRRLGVGDLPPVRGACAVLRDGQRRGLDRQQAPRRHVPKRGVGGVVGSREVARAGRLECVSPATRRRRPPPTGRVRDQSMCRAKAIPSGVLSRTLSRPSQSHTMYRTYGSAVSFPASPGLGLLRSTRNAALVLTDASAAAACRRGSVIPSKREAAAGFSIVGSAGGGWLTRAFRSGTTRDMSGTAFSSCWTM